MLYIHHTSCISPQSTFLSVDLEILRESVENKLTACEPTYEGIPNSVLRRMGKAVRISTGAALPLIKPGVAIDGIIIGTANGGMEDCIKFMNQIVQYNEGLLTPGNFVQSTPNGLAAQIALLSNNKSYNITHVHRGLSFENALLDAILMLKDFPENTYLLGAADEISTYNYNVDFLAGWYKKEIVSNRDLFSVNSPASIAGEGAAMFLVNSCKTGSMARVKAIQTFHSEDQELIKSHLGDFIRQHFPSQESPDILISGENGDNRLLSFYLNSEELMGKETTILRFKHLCGEYPTASSQALWLGCYILATQTVPTTTIKKQPKLNPIKTILIYNNYKGLQHSFILLSGDA